MPRSWFGSHLPPSPTTMRQTVHKVLTNPTAILFLHIPVMGVAMVRSTTLHKHFDIPGFTMIATE